MSSLTSSETLQTEIADFSTPLERLRAVLLPLGKVIVAFSGGVDSALVAWVATDLLGEANVLCVTASSPSLAQWELDDVRELAFQWGLRWKAENTSEMSDPNYVTNDTLRCYHCKSALMDVLEPLAQAEQATVALGVNLDDLNEHRPGQQAAASRGAVFPLVQANLNKEAIRQLSRELGLRTWDKPAAACLASRVPHGTAVTLGVLTKVAAAESSLRDLGFDQLRVRHYGDVARIEFEVQDLSRALELRERVIVAVKSAGYQRVTLDLEGFRSGNLSQPHTAG